MRLAEITEEHPQIRGKIYLQAYISDLLRNSPASPWKVREGPGEGSVVRKVGFSLVEFASLLILFLMLLLYSYLFSWLRLRNWKPPGTRCGTIAFEKVTVSDVSEQVRPPTSWFISPQKKLMQVRFGPGTMLCSPKTSTARGGTIAFWEH